MDKLKNTIVNGKLKDYTRDDLKLKLENINAYLNSLKEAPTILEEWDRLLFNSIIGKVVFYENKSLGFKFVNGKVIKLQL